MQNWKAMVKFIDFSKDIPIAIIHMTWPYHMDSSGHELSFLVMHAAYFYDTYEYGIAQLGQKEALNTNIVRIADTFGIQSNFY